MKFSKHFVKIHFLFWQTFLNYSIIWLLQAKSSPSHTALHTAFCVTVISLFIVSVNAKPLFRGPAHAIFMHHTSHTPLCVNSPLFLIFVTFCTRKVPDRQIFSSSIPCFTKLFNKAYQLMDVSQSLLWCWWVCWCVFKSAPFI